MTVAESASATPLRKFRFAAGGEGNPEEGGARKFIKLAQQAEEYGFDSFMIPDHLGPQVDPIAALGALAVATEKIRLALRSHLRVVADQLDVATVFVQEWRYLEGERRDEIVGERRRYEERIRGLFREGRDLGELRADLDDATAALLVLSAANWAYTWLQPGRDTDELADRFYSLLLDGMRGYATPT